METERRFTGLLAIFLMMSASASPAQEVRAGVPNDTLTYILSPVIINPTRAVERESPVTFSNLGFEELQERYSLQDVPVLLAELPSSTYYSENGNGIGYNYINLRGFDQRRLSIMVNGVPQNDPEDHSVYWIDVPDLLASTSSIQVQRGAGSAFYGPPAIGGSINLGTGSFARKQGVSLESMVGFQEFADSGTSFPLTTQKYAASLSTGLLDGHYMGYARFARLMSDGYRQNSWVRMSSYFIGVLRVDPTMTTRVHFFGGPLRDALAYNGLPRFVNDQPAGRRRNLSSWEVDSTGKGFAGSQSRRPEETEEFSQPHYELLNEWKLSERVTLFNTFFYYEGNGSYDYDASWADSTMLRVGSAYGIPVTDNLTNTLVRAFVGNKQGGWLPRLEYSHDAGRLTLGAEARIHRSVHWGRVQSADRLPASFPADYHFYEYNGIRDIFSLYAQEMYQPGPDVTLMANLQLAANRYGINNEKYLGYSFRVPYLFLNPRVGINVNLSKQWNTYLSLALTSREPRMRNLYAAEDSYFGATPQFRADTAGGIVRYDFDHPLAEPERLLNVEIGGGYREGPSFITANLYWMEFEHELVKSGQVDIFGQAVTGNADRSRHIGMEIEGSTPLNNTFTVEGNATVSVNKLIRYTILGDQGNPVSLDGNPVAGFPDFLGNVRLVYHGSLITASLSGKYVGGFYTDNFRNDSRYNSAFEVLDAMALLHCPRLLDFSPTVRLEVRNLFNKLYFASGEGDAFFPAAERNVLVGLTFTQ